MNYTCIPLILTLSRLLIGIFIMPIFLVLLPTFSSAYAFSVGLFFLAIVTTDFLDGYYARRLQATTLLGKWLDPIADKCLIITAYISLLAIGYAPLWLVLVIVTREVLVTALRAICVHYGIIIHVSQIAKWKMTLQSVGVVVLILSGSYSSVLCTLLCALIAFLTIWSGMEYGVRAYYLLKENKDLRGF